jgi:hypothetical protein
MPGSGHSGVSDGKVFRQVLAASSKARQVLEMGEWKTALSLRVRQSLKDDLQKIADREYRKLGNLGELLTEWSYQQFTAAGSTAKLLKRKVCTSAQGSDVWLFSDALIFPIWEEKTRTNTQIAQHENVTRTCSPFLSGRPDKTDRTQHD